MEKEFISSIEKILNRDLQKLKEEINLYPTDEKLWKIEGEIKNSASNLCLHLCGNLQHFIGAVLGNSGYVRNRENEFTARGLSKQELQVEIDTTIKAVNNALKIINPAILTTDYPIKVMEQSVTTTQFLIHLTSHFEYHLGQINYHRRLSNLFDGD
jgi:uncharacterized damage-inducible protein DinB